MNLDQHKLNALLGLMVNEIGAAANAPLVMIGDKLGLYRALKEPRTSAELAKATGTNERLVREWLAAQATSGYVTYDSTTRRFSLTPEQAAVFADDDSPVNMTGGFYSLAAVYASERKLTEAFKTGKGIGWSEQCSCLFCGVDRFFRPGYKAHLVNDWLPALDGVVAKLKKGARVADVGCGHGSSTIMMADAFPNSEFIGFDFHDDSVREARSRIAGRKNIRFEVARAQDYPDRDYDLVTIFDALHDMGDPVSAASHVRGSLASDGTLMLVEPMAADTLEGNFNPIGRVFYACSTSICVPTSLSQEVGAALGVQAGQARLEEVLRQGGFTRLRCATETPFNMVLEARP